MFVVVNFDALAQASDILIERGQVVFLCWMQDSNPRSQPPIHQQTECLLTNRLSYRGSGKNLNSTARPYDQQAFSPLDLTASWLSHLALAIYMLVVVNFDALAQASDIRIERRQVVFLCWMQDSNPPIRHSKCRKISPDLIGRDQSRCAPSQCETSLHCNDVSHWLGAYLDWSLHWSIWMTSSWSLWSTKVMQHHRQPEELHS